MNKFKVHFDHGSNFFRRHLLGCHVNNRPCSFFPFALFHRLLINARFANVLYVQHGLNLLAAKPSQLIDDHRFNQFYQIIP